MKIIDTDLRFGTMSVRKRTRRIILHHAEASSCTASQIHSWHKARGWSGAGYHFLVRKNGKIYRLRPEKYVGAHASGNNSDSLGICFEGSYMKETMPDAQIQAGAELVSYLKEKYGISKVQRHKDVCPTDCPGTNFPFSSIVSGSGTSTASKKTGASTSKLTVDGKIGSKTIKRLQKKLGTTQDGEITGQYSAYKKFWPSIVEGCDWDGGKSEVVKALQKWAGADQDGILGQGTAKAVQKKLNKAGYECPKDGTFGTSSAKALQKWLNS